MRLVFSGKEKLRLLSNYGKNPVARFSWQRFDGNVEVVTESVTFSSPQAEGLGWR
jgi:hypothetical protein